nr:hypothetical protein KitaXyl93_61410 [Kitasatospora sp. Xyl93]
MEQGRHGLVLAGRKGVRDRRDPTGPPAAREPGARLMVRGEGDGFPFTLRSGFAHGIAAGPEPFPGACYGTGRARTQVRSAVR